MEEQPEYTLPVIADFDMKYVTNIQPTVSTISYPLNKNRMDLYFDRREIKSLSQLLRQVNCFKNHTHKERQYKHTLRKDPIILTDGKKTLTEILLYS